MAGKFEKRGFCQVKRGLAWILVGGLMASMLGGCQKSGADGETSGRAEQDGQGSGTEVSQAPGDEKSKPDAMGRYGEVQVQLPEKVEDQSYVGFLRGEGGNMELYTVERDGDAVKVTNAFRYIYREGAWQCDESWEGQRD